MKRYQRFREIPPIIRQGSRLELVGIIKLVNPSPHWRVNTPICRVIPNTSANGAIMGITTAVWPEPEGMKKLIRALAMNIPMAATLLGR